MGMHHRLPGGTPGIHAKVVGVRRKFLIQNLFAARNETVKLFRFFLVKVEEALEVPQRDHQQMARRDREGVEEGGEMATS